MRIEQILSRIAHNWPAKAMSIAAAALLFLFHRIGTLEERFFSVPIEIIVDENYAPANPYPRTAKVSIRGERDTVFRILEDDIELYADFSQHHAEGIFKEPVQYYKKGNALESSYFEMSIEPLEIVLNLEDKAFKTITVEETIVGFPEKGYELGQYFIEPNTVVVEGPVSHIRAIVSIPTDPIDITGKTGKIDILVPLDLTDPYLKIKDNETVRFSGTIQETKITRTYDPVDIILFDLPENSRILSNLPQGVVKIQGAVLLIDKLGTDDIILTGDCSSIKKSGTYEIPVTPILPDGIIVLTYSPEKISVTLQIEEKTQ